MSRVHVDRLSAIESTLQKQYGNEQWNLFHFFIWIWIKYWISIKINSQTFVSTKSNSCLFIAIKFYVNTIRHVHEYMRMLSADALCLKMWSSRLGSVTNYEFIAQWSVDSVRHESVHITTRLQQVDCATFIPISWDQNSICCCRWRRKFVHNQNVWHFKFFRFGKIFWTHRNKCGNSGRSNGYSSCTMRSEKVDLERLQWHKICRKIRRT